MGEPERAVGLCDPAQRETQGQEYQGRILVPFPVESALSGVGKAVGGENQLWYRRTFEVLDTWRTRQIRLNFEAVDWETTVWVNGQKVGTHHGGYDPFSFDITDALNKEGPQEVVLAVWDPTDIGKQPRGKQVGQPHGIWYTAVTGIWRTVWLEPVSPVHIHSLRIESDVDGELIRVKVECQGDASNLRVSLEALEGKVSIAGGRGQPEEENPAFSEKAKTLVTGCSVSLRSQAETGG